MVDDTVTGMRVDVEATVDAPPDRVWDLLTDVTHVGRWSPECVHTEWLDDDRTPRVGARFTGLNRSDNGFEWRVTCVVVEADRPRSFSWIVLDDDEAPDVNRPSSVWRYDLSVEPGGRTRVREVFEHGPGESGLRWWIRERPDLDPADIVEHRREQLRHNMTATMAAMARAAEARG